MDHGTWSRDMDHGTWSRDMARGTWSRDMAHGTQGHDSLPLEPGHGSWNLELAHEGPIGQYCPQINEWANLSMGPDGTEPLPFGGLQKPGPKLVLAKNL